MERMCIMRYKLSDFKVGQKAYIELTGNAKRGKVAKENLIIECTVENIGRKYVTANGIKFEEHNTSHGGLIEHTSYCVDYVLYPTKQAVEERLEKEELIFKIRHFFDILTNSKAKNISLEKLRKINEIIEQE